jgi:ElaB/YqjD/DUF883 family membrane-anchored ribosome-binding protein
MNADAGTSESVSARTSANGLHPRNRTAQRAETAENPRAEKPKEVHEPIAEDLSEGELLQHEMETAKAAMVQTLRELQQDLTRAADLQKWTREHPWAAVGVAAATGFATAAALTAGTSGNGRRSPRRRRAKRREPEQAQTSAFGWLWNPLFDLVKTAVTTTIATSVQAASQTPPPPDGQSYPVEAAARAGH